MDPWEQDILGLEEDVQDLTKAMMGLLTPPQPELIFEKIHKSAQLPAYATAWAAGMDVRSVEEVSLEPGDRKAIATGLRVIVPFGWELQVRPRSGLALKNGITVLNAPGTIDSDYRGEIKVILHNVSKVPYDTFKVAVGDRIAQLVLSKAPQAKISELVGELPSTERGSGGFGSTGTT